MTREEFSTERFRDSSTFMLQLRIGSEDGESGKAKWIRFWERRKCEYQAFCRKIRRPGAGIGVMKDLGKKKNREPGFCTKMLSNKENDEVLGVVVASIVQRVVGQTFSVRSG